MLKSDYDQWALVYDALNADYRKDIDFYREEAKRAQGKILEVACGTGRIYIELLQNGLDAYGMDLSEKMLTVLKQKLIRLKLPQKVFRANMRDFSLKERFDLIIIPFRSFLHNLTSTEQIQALKNLKAHLQPQGRLILNFFPPNPEFLVQKKDTYSEKIKIRRDTYKMEIQTYFLDQLDHIVESITRVYKKETLLWQGAIRYALIFKKEFELLLRLAGFSRWAIYGGFEYQPFVNNKQEMVWVIQKGSNES